MDGRARVPDVALPDEDARVMDGLCEAQLEDQGLQTALQEVGGREGQHVIQLVLRLVQQAVLVHAPHQSLALKHALRVCRIQRQQGAGRL